MPPRCADWPIGKDGKHLPLVDTLTPGWLNVRSRDIEIAEPNDGRYCVVARTAARALAAEWVYVWVSKMYILRDVEDEAVRRYCCSAALTRNVIRPLDEGRPDLIVPGDYALLVPPPKQRLGVNRAAKPGAVPRPPKPERGKSGVGRIDRNSVYWRGAAA